MYSTRTPPLEPETVVDYTLFRFNPSFKINIDLHSVTVYQFYNKLIFF